MTRSHVLLHSPNVKLREAGNKATGRKDTGRCESFVAQPHRWERRLVKFLELSGVGRVIADRADEDGAVCRENV
jgi:hypothetical protein